jgi:hypothetical protein
MIGFERTPAKFFWYLFFMFFTLLYFTLFGMMLAGATPDHNIAAIVSFGFYILWNLFSGFVIPRTVSFSVLFASLLILNHASVNRKVNS